MPRATRPTEETYTASELPEVLRSVAVAGIVVAAAEREAALLRESDDSFALASASVLQSFVTELEDWHHPKPRPVELNGG